MRRPNIRSAAGDLGFLAIALIAGLAGAPLAVAGAVCALAALVWWWTRRRVLEQMPPRQRLTQSALALVMLAVVLGIFYWLGRMLGGHA
jgi:hypothetical protein